MNKREACTVDINKCLQSVESSFFRLQSNKIMSTNKKCKTSFTGKLELGGELSPVKCPIVNTNLVG